MTLVQGSIPNFINGVSRQPDSSRLSSQVEEQINCYSSPQVGLMPRGALFHTKNLGLASGNNVYVHPIKRDSTERYFAILTNGDLKVYDLFGAEKTVNFPDGKTYLSGPQPHENFRAVTNADHTFIVNRNQTISMDATSATQTRAMEALIYVRAVNHGKTYQVYLNDTTGGRASPNAAYTTPENTAGTDAELQAKQMNTTPNNVAKELYNDLNGSMDPLIWDFTLYENVIHVKKISGIDDFTIAVSGGDNAPVPSITAIKGRITNFSDLPNHGPEGFVVRVTGQPSDDRDDYWVKIGKDGNDYATSSIYWEECQEQGTIIAFDASTMPHVLVREADGTFTFRKADWGKRKVGNAAVSPVPSFVTETGIQAMFFHHGRLGFLVRDSVVMSRPGQFFDFWRSTMTAVLDDDPIDVSIADGPVALFKRALVWEGDLYLLSDETIHRMNAGQILTPNSVSIDLIKHEAINPSADPVVTPRSLIYASRTTGAFGASLEPHGDLREMVMSDTTEREVSGSITDHAPGYLPASIRSMVSSPVNNIVAVLPEGSPNNSSLFIYQYYWVGDEKVQSAWHRWDLDSSLRIMGAEFFENELHIVFREKAATNGFSLGYIPIQAFLRDLARDWMIRLDRRVSSGHSEVIVSPYNELANRTRFDLPYAPTGDTIAVYGPSDPLHGLPIEVQSRDSTGIFLVGNHEATDVVFGNVYEQRATLSKLYMKETRGGRGGSVALISERLQLHRMVFSAHDTGSFRAETKPYSSAPARVATFQAFSANDGEASQIGSAVLDTEALTIGVNAKASRALVEIVNDTHYPFAIQGAEWYGTYAPKAKRVG